MNWYDHQSFEQNFWGNCVNTLNEELKQLVYAKHMGLELSYDNDRSSPYSIDINNKKILDIGGGPCSLLLKCRNISNCMIADPCIFPDWITSRYNSLNIIELKIKAEDLDIINNKFDEIWMYNTIQHTNDPIKIAKNIRNKTNYIRIFEWCTEPHIGHPIQTNKKILDDLFLVDGKTGILNGENECYGEFWCYNGIIN